MNQCPLAGWEIIDEALNPFRIRNYFYFKIRNDGKNYFYLLEDELLNNLPILKNNQHIFRWIFLNNFFIKNHNSQLFESVNDVSWDSIQSHPENYGLTLSEYKDYISNFERISPKEKLNFLLLKLYEWKNENYEIYKDLEFIIRNSGFKNQAEVILFFEVLQKMTFLEFKISDNELFVWENESSNLHIRLTYQGISEVAILKESGQNSRKCFVAISFDKSMNETREAIRKGINEAKYDAIFIDEIYTEADKTINDAIIAEIKRSKFLVADFTKQSNGVYFEAGYALGRGLKVIYCCEEKDFKENSHFDLKPFSHILYNSNEELCKRLKLKIEAWIE